jgi:hypothetical protein
MAVECRTASPMLDGPTRSAVESIANEWLGRDVSVTATADLGGSSRSTVMRVDLGECRVVVKQQRSASAFDPRDMSDFGPAERFWNEIVGLELLASRAALRGVAPRVIGYSSTLGLVVLEDVGDCPSLADLLLGTDAAAAQRGLVAWARTLGTIHAASPGPAGLDEFEALWKRRAGRPAPCRRGVGHLRERWAAIINTAHEVGVVAPNGVERDVVRALYDAVDAGPFLAYSTGDPCPGNFLFRSDGSVCVVDVEYGAYRHALLDGAYTRLGFATCWCVGGVPPAVRVAAEMAYRNELARGVPEAADDGAYDAARSAGAVMLVGHVLGSALPRALAGDADQLRVLTSLEALAEMCGGNQERATIAELSSMVAAALRRKWGLREPDLALFPAFRPR